MSTLLDKQLAKILSMIYFIWEEIILKKFLEINENFQIFYLQRWKYN